MKYQFFNLPDWNQISLTHRLDLAEESSENLLNFQIFNKNSCFEITLLSEKLLNKKTAETQSTQREEV